MKSNAKLKIIILITLEILLVSAPKITFTADNNVINFDKENLIISAVSGKIHIDDDNPIINWTVAKKDGICTGNGTYSDPYVIEDLEIDSKGSGSCILIENSEVYFRIENCTLFNSGEGYREAGIHLVNVNNGQMLNNNCSNNSNKGIRLWNCNNSIISGNILNKNFFYGITLYGSHNYTISGNIISNTYIGIIMQAYGPFKGDNNVITGNLMNGCGLKMHGNLETLLSHEIDTTNLVNGKPLYYYTNEVNLSSNDFPNAGQVMLVNCSDSFISNLKISYTTIAISLHYCNNNIISGNTLNNNTYYGIFLVYSDNNYISGNNANNNNGSGICLWDSNYNILSGNTAFYNIECGIILFESNYNTISRNTANYNQWGIILYTSSYNTILGNIVIGNDECIVELNCQGNVIQDNDCTLTPLLNYLPSILIISTAIIGVSIFMIYKNSKMFKKPQEDLDFL